jgi:CRISPR-associated protein Csx17
VLHVVGGPPTLEDLLDELVRVAETQTEADVNKREWTQYDRAWSDAQKKGTKAGSGMPLALWQAEAPEAQLLLFAAHAVPYARVSFNPVLGSGGNAGRRDFSKGWKKAVDALARPPQSAKNALKAWLLGQPVTWMLEKLAAGSWFSEATKLYNSGQSPAREGRISPWAMVLACEGLSFLAGGASRRLGARATHPEGAFPFITQPIAASAEREADRLQGEIWTPLWSRPMSLAEARTLFSRGRAELRGRGALTPAAFATAIRERGVDAGVSEFRRFTLGRTTSSNTFEPRFEGRFSLDTGATPASAATASTLERITALIEQGGFPRDRKRFVGLRGPIESALLDVAAQPDNPELAIALLDAVVRALDRIDRNRSFREGKVRWEPLPLQWLSSLFSKTTPGNEARLALSLVSAFPETLPFAAFRFGVEWAREKVGTYEYDWTTRPSRFEHARVAPARWVWGPGELPRLLGAVLARRLLEEAKLDATHTERPRGRAPIPATTSQVRQWLTGDLDESLLSAWLSRLALFDWRWVPKELRSFATGEEEPPERDGALALFGLLQPLIDQRPLVVRHLSDDDLLSKETGARTTEAARSLVTLVRAGHLDAALRLASSRFSMAGARLAEFRVSFATHAPDRLVAALLFPVSDSARLKLFERWLRPQRRPQRGEMHV